MSIKIPRNKLYFTKGALLKASGLLFTKRTSEGGYIHKFEKEFSNFIGIKHAIAFSSGKLALYLCLKALGAKSGDKIILSDFNVPEVVALLISYGLSPVLLDIDPYNFNINIELIEKNIDKKTKFLLVTHIYGTPVDMEKIVYIAKKYGLKIIEDACQAVGAEYKGKKAGGLGDISYFSFGTLKIFSTLNGGMILTDDDTIALSLREEIKKYHYPKRGKLLSEILKVNFIMFFTNPKVFNNFTFPILFFIDRYNEELRFKLFQGKEISHISSQELSLLKEKFSNLQAFIGLENFKSLEDNISRYSAKAALLNGMLIQKGILFQQCPENSKSAYFKYVIRARNREQVLKRMFNSGVDLTCGYIKSCSSITNFKEFSMNCPESLRLMRENIYLPIHSLTSYDHARYMVGLLSKVVER